MEELRAVAVHGMVRDAGGRVLLGRGSDRADFPGVWGLPGGGLAHAEDPARGVVRAVGETAGLTVEVVGLRAAVADVAAFPELGVALHTDRLIFDLAVASRTERCEPDGRPGRRDSDDPDRWIDQVRWLTPDEAAALPLLPFTAELLGLPVNALPDDMRRRRKAFPPPAVDRRQRFGAYGLVTDPSSRVLLTMIAEGYPGAGRWHLPGGGTDHGEQPTTGLLRELVEEAGQLGRVVGLIGVNNLHNPAALGPEGRPMDWHGIRVVYRVAVDAPTEPLVTELAGGSTDRAGWFTPEQLTGLPLTELTVRAVSQWNR